MEQLEKSTGHILFFKDPHGSVFEMYEEGGSVYRAPIHNVMELNSGNRFGRWECGIELWESSVKKSFEPSIEVIK